MRPGGDAARVARTLGVAARLAALDFAAPEPRAWPGGRLGVQDASSRREEDRGIWHTYSCARVSLEEEEENVAISETFYREPSR